MHFLKPHQFHGIIFMMVMMAQVSVYLILICLFFLISGNIFHQRMVDMFCISLCIIQMT
jgi:hypothetical protein